ncbi:hypothetical protein PAEPH01_2471 [Pancytospora epiphaga]|nr:hypothetical protein PAEPH01_2471 [Pancytospora epiphaga]
MTWDGMVMNDHKQYSREIGLTDSVEVYIHIQTIVLKKTLESISFKYRRGPTQGGDAKAITVRYWILGKGQGNPEAPSQGDKRDIN